MAALPSLAPPWGDVGLQPHLAPFPQADAPVIRKEKVHLAGMWVEACHWRGFPKQEKIGGPWGWERSNSAKVSCSLGTWL